MKKTISVLLLICILSLCLASCGGNKTDVDITPPDTSSNNQLEQETHTPYDAFVFYQQSSDTYVVGIAPEGKYYTEIVIPSTYNGGKVVGILKEGFKDCENLISIKIPTTVTEIKESAFYGCKNMKTIEFSNSVKKIEENAFTNCSRKESVLFNGTVQDWVKIKFEGSIYADYFSNDWLLESNPLCYGADLYFNGELFTTLDLNNTPWLSEYEIGKYFSWCTSLENVVISESATSIRELSFYSCKSLEYVLISDTVKSIESCAFSECGSLKNITIPKSVTTIERNAFSYCSSLKTITYEGTKSEWNAINKELDWDVGIRNYTINCSDGTITK